MRRVTLLPTVLCLLLIASGCKQLKEELEQKARENSLKKPHSTPSLTLDSNGCPPGTEPRDIGADGSPAFCADPPGERNLAHKLDETWPNGQPKVRYVVFGEALKVSKFYRNGAPQEEIHYLHNKKNGPWTEWYQDQKQKTVGSFKADLKHGEFTYFDKHGRPVERGVFIADAKHGVWQRYQNGKLVARETYRRGVKHGNAEYLNTNGAVVSHGAYEAGRKAGRWLTYYDTGEVKSDGYFREGKQEGRWVDYSTDGKARTAFYKDGQLSTKSSLRGQLSFERNEILGAAPRLNNRPRSPVKQPKRRESKELGKGQGWSPL